VTVGGEFWATGNNGAYSDSRIKANFKRIDKPLTRRANAAGMTFDRLIFRWAAKRACAPSKCALPAPRPCLSCQPRAHERVAA
jgi:hypothetical protein